jgi:hypothetical protein
MVLPFKFVSDCPSIHCIYQDGSFLMWFFCIKICIIGINWQKEQFHRKIWINCCTSHCHAVAVNINMTKMFLIKWSFLSNLSLTAPPYIVYIKMAAFPNNRNFLKCLYYCFTWSQSELKFKLQLHDNEKYNNLSRFF